MDRLRFNPNNAKELLRFAPILLSLLLHGCGEAIQSKTSIEGTLPGQSKPSVFTEFQCTDVVMKDGQLERVDLPSGPVFITRVPEHITLNPSSWRSDGVALTDNTSAVIRGKGAFFQREFWDGGHGNPPLPPELEQIPTSFILNTGSDKVVTVCEVTP